MHSKRPFAALAPEGAMAAYRTPSVSGCAIYRGDADGEAVRLMKARGPAKPSGCIALLHIDGNHDVACAAEDVALWSPLVAPGGWVAIDDYCWRYGDGPKRAGDALLASWAMTWRVRMWRAIAFSSNALERAYCKHRLKLE